MRNDEKTCIRCGETWPADTEFFRQRTGLEKLHGSCRACESERKRGMSRAKAITEKVTHGKQTVETHLGVRRIRHRMV